MHTPLMPCLQVTPVHTGLEDRHPYVRRTAVMGVLKIHHIESHTIVNTGEWCVRVGGCVSGVCAWMDG